MRKNQVQGLRCKVQTANSLNLAPKGFTLIEVLIAMTLLSIMMVLLFTSLKICADSWGKGEAKITDVNEIAVVYNFFQRDLSGAKPLWNDSTAVEKIEEKTFSFQGSSQSLQFVSAFPASAGRPGLQLFSLSLQEEDNDQIIKVNLTPFVPLTEGQEWHKEEVTLIKHVSDFKLAYFGSEDGVAPSDWTEEWLNKAALPRLVKINIALDNGIYWPEMIIDLKVTGTTDSAGPGTGNAGNTSNLQNIN
jgi:general secretion pathway protein J